MPSKSNRKAIVIGAGIIGLATACRLAQNGFDVQVIEQNDGPGEGTSKANAGQLSFDRIGAMGSPGFLRNIPGTLLDTDQGIVANRLLHPANWPWASAFARQCTQQAWRQNTKNLIEIAHRSRSSMAKFNDIHPVEFNRRISGKIVIYQDQEGLAAARQVARYQAEFGGRHQILNAGECIEREQALVGGSRKIAGGVFMPDAEVGDCNSYCQSLAHLLVHTLGGGMTYDTAVTGFERENGRVKALHTNRGLVEGDLFVVATGSDTPALLSRGFSRRKPIAGVKGISLTYSPGKTPPDLSIKDDDGKFVIMRLGEQIRVTGYAIFSDNLSINPKHVQHLVNKAKALMPQAANYDETPEIWAGLRPQTPDDLPMIGQAGAKNLYVNAGHGSLGWTLAFGSAEVLLTKIDEDMA